MEATIREGQAPAVIVSLQPGETLTTEAGAMMFISGDISTDVEMPGGLVGGLKRKLLAGESLFLMKYKARGAGAVGITGPFPGSIRQHELDGEIICEKHAYLGHHGEVEIDLVEGQRLIVDTGCMVMIEPTVKYEVKLQSGIAKGLFGGEGMFLVHMTGPGHATLQTLPFTRTARRVLAAAGGGGDETGVGGILGGIIG